MGNYPGEVPSSSTAAVMPTPQSAVGTPAAPISREEGGTASPAAGASGTEESLLPHGPSPVCRGHTGGTLTRGALVLVADDEPVTREMLRRLVESAGYRVIETGGGRQAIAQMSPDVALVLLDLCMPDVSGLDVLRHVRKHFVDVQVIMISGTGQIRDAVATMKEGAFDYLTKPWNQDDLLIRIGQAVRVSQLARENRNLKWAIGYPLTAAKLVGSSPAMEEVREQIATLARLDSTVLITGPTGTGKTITAQMIHASGPRSARPFVAVNCRALPQDLIEAELFGYARGAFTGATSDRPGRAEIAHGGTLLLDEIGDLPLGLQPKLLTFLQENTVQRLGSNTVKEVDVRVIAATSQDLTRICRQGGFRKDLFFRLNILPLRTPALAEHPDDVPEVAREVLRRIARRRGSAPVMLSPQALEALRAYDWPGNVREMENVLERAWVTSDGSTIRRQDFALGQLRGCQPASEHRSEMGLAGMTLAEIERRAIMETLDACGGNRSKTARTLEVSEKTIYNKLKKYSLNPTL